METQTLRSYYRYLLGGSMKLIGVLALLILAMAWAQACAAVPVTHPGDILLPTFDGRVVLFHPETGTSEDFASLGTYRHPTAIVREATGDFLICDDYSSAILRLNGTTGALSVV